MPLHVAQEVAFPKSYIQHLLQAFLVTSKSKTLHQIGREE